MSRHKKLTIVSVSSEVESFAKAGGLADVSRALPKAIHLLGHSVIAFAPLHQMVSKNATSLQKVVTGLPILIDGTKTIYADIWSSMIDNEIPIYFIDGEGIFSRYKRIYGSRQENRRFYFFNLAVLAAIEHLQIQPDLIHCHDWQTGLIPELLHHRFADRPTFQKTATLFTIHNLVFQLGKNWWEISEKKRDTGRTPIPLWTSPQIHHLNFARRAIIHADLINAVSEQYAEEIVSQEYGQDLERLLWHRKEKNKLFGVVNGVDYLVYNPKTDPGLCSNYDADALENKLPNKLFLQRESHLPENPKIPVIGMATRITEQKGFELLMEIGDHLMETDVQLIVRGDGDERYKRFIRRLHRKYPKKIGAHLEFNTEKATQVYAGSDIFLVPSRFEPCGLGQLISLRYGTIPVVHSVGGLADTISDFNPRTRKGNGFSFRRYHAVDFLMAVVRAVENFKHGEVWRELTRMAMLQSFSWTIPAKKYARLYRMAMKNHQDHF